MPLSMGREYKNGALMSIYATLPHPPNSTAGRAFLRSLPQKSVILSGAKNLHFICYGPELQILRYAQDHNVSHPLYFLEPNCCASPACTARNAMG